MTNVMSPARDAHAQSVRRTGRASRRTNVTVRRAAGIAAGVLTHVLFAGTVWYLFWFLRLMEGRPAFSQTDALLIDSGLALQFAIPHSILLHPATRTRLSRWITSPFYGLFFCAVTCLSLLLTIALWQNAQPVVWDLTGMAGALMQTGFLLSWIALFYSLAISGLGYQTGLTPWLAWMRRQQPGPRRFSEVGWYRWFRHPIYLSFLGLIWFTPRMTLDHALLTGIWTVYIFVGSWLKDRRLEFYAGDAYREYESRVPGYPLMTTGPLGLRSPVVVNDQDL